MRHEARGRGRGICRSHWAGSKAADTGRVRINRAVGQGSGTEPSVQLDGLRVVWMGVYSPLPGSPTNGRRAPFLSGGSTNIIFVKIKWIISFRTEAIFEFFAVLT